MARILIIDDSRLSVSALNNMLTTAGHQVVGTAFNGEDGVKLTSELKPDYVTLDFVMPDIDGKETAKRIKGLGGNTKIIMITQNEIPDNVKSEINAVSYVIKPITANKINSVFA